MQLDKQNKATRKDQEYIYIYYSVNWRLYKQLLISLISLSKSNKDNKLYIINLEVCVPEYCPSDKRLNVEQIATIETIMKKYNKENIFVNIDCSALSKKYFILWGANDKPFGETPSGFRHPFPAYLWTRFLLPFVNTTNIKKIIWLDADTIVLKNLSNFWNINIDDYHWAGRPDLSWWQSKRFPKAFLQNGVMLLNLKKISPEFKKIVMEARQKNYGQYGDMAILNSPTFLRKIISEKFNSFKYSNDAYIHHVCCTSIKGGWIFSKMFFNIKFRAEMKQVDWKFPFSNFFGNNDKIIKPDNIIEMIALYPQYEWLYNDFKNMKVSYK